MRELNPDRETEAAVLGALEVHGPHLGGCWTHTYLTTPAAGRDHFRFLGVGRCKPSFRQSR